MSTGKHIRIRLTPDQRQELEGMTRAGEASARTRTLLLTDREVTPHRTDGEIASALLCSLGTVRAIRRRFHEEGLQAALVGKPRPGRCPR